MPVRDQFMNTSNTVIREFNNIRPNLGQNVFVDSSAVVIGDVSIGDDSSIWPQCAVRGDMHRICIGARSNIQDCSVLHITHAGPFNADGWPLNIGDDVTVGHRAILHGCTIGNRVLVGMGAVVMDGAIVEDDVVIGANTLVPGGKHLTGKGLYMGSPAKRVRDLSDKELELITYSANNYVQLKNEYMAAR